LMQILRINDMTQVCTTNDSNDKQKYLKEKITRTLRTQCIRFHSFYFESS